MLVPGGTPLIDFTFGNALTVGLLGAVGFLMVFGGLALATHYNIPLLSPLATSITAVFNLAAKAV